MGGSAARLCPHEQPLGVQYWIKNHFNWNHFISFNVGRYLYHIDPSDPIDVRSTDYDIISRLKT